MARRLLRANGAGRSFRADILPNTMRWSIIRLIWVRELRDQLRDRRTLFMIAVLPLLLYPVVGIGLLGAMLGLLQRPGAVGVYNASALPQLHKDKSAGHNPLPATAWLATMPAPPVDGTSWLVSSFTLAQLNRAGLGQDYPPLFLKTAASDELHISPLYFDTPDENQSLPVVSLGEMSAEEIQRQIDEIQKRPEKSAELLREKKLDVLIFAAPDSQERLERDDRPVFYVLAASDERSRLASSRVHAALARWEKQVKEVRLLRRGLSSTYDRPIQVLDPDRDKTAARRAEESVFDLMGKIFPFLLVMWSLAGALYPAVDLCAGEKERGTMETLLISPASREEIVYGKFLAIWVFSAATALLNLISMGITTWLFLARTQGHLFRPEAMFWCLVLLLPLSAFFSAICLAIGAYARSTKEGQYYLMPLFLITMPLIFLTLIPGVRLGPFTAMVPVTGVALLLHQLLAIHLDAQTDKLIWLYFVPVLGPMLIYGWLALRWAIYQFQREEVLFREAERVDLRLWLKSLYREKQLMPTAGQAIFSFGLILGLRWFTLVWSAAVSLVLTLALRYLAFVLLPTLLSVFALNKRPFDALSLRWCSWRSVFTAAALAVLLLVPLAELKVILVKQFPAMQVLLQDQNLAARDSARAGENDGPNHGWAMKVQYLLLMGLLAPVCEELAFRGLILTGLFRSFKPWTAVLLSSFLFAVYKANVFQFVPSFVLGVVLAMFTARTRSILPALMFHSVYNTVLMLIDFSPGSIADGFELPQAVRLIIAGLFLAVALCLLGRLWIRGYRFFEINDPALEKVASE
jgi:sodium transport system permease protein